MSHESKRQKRKRQRAARKEEKRRKREADRKAKALHDKLMDRFRLVCDRLASRLRAIWKLTWWALGVGGVLVGLYQARPSVDVTAHRSANPNNPYRYRFTIENDGILFDLVDLDVTCEAISFESRDRLECAQADGPQDLELKKGKSQSIDCISLSYPESMVAVRFDAHVVTNYSVEAWPGHRFEDITRFVGRAYGSRFVDVEEQPADMAKLRRCREIQVAAARRRDQFNPGD